MTALPPSLDFTAASNQDAYKASVAAQRGFLAGLLGEDGTVATALAALGALGGGYVAKTGVYTATTADRGMLIDATNTWTLSLPAAASAGAGFTIALRNSGTGIITVDPDGAENIDGASTLDFGPGAGGLIVSTGTGWLTAGPRVQSSATDTTVGSALLNGAFGMGLNAVNGNDAPGDDLDALTIQGIWRFSTTTTGRGVMTRGSVIHFNRTVGATTGPYMQLALTYTGEIFTRYYDTGAWTTWVQGLQEGVDIGATTPAAATFTEATVSGALNLGGNITGGEEQTIADDAVGTFTPPPGFTGGWVRVTCRGDHNAPDGAASADLWVDMGTGLDIHKSTGWATIGSDVDVVTTDVAGTTGTDDKLTIAVQAGALKLENRLGGSRPFRVKWG